MGISSSVASQGATERSGPLAIRKSGLHERVTDTALEHAPTIRKTARDYVRSEPGLRRPTKEIWDGLSLAPPVFTRRSRERLAASIPTLVRDITALVAHAKGDVAAFCHRFRLDAPKRVVLETEMTLGTATGPVSIARPDCVLQAGAMYVVEPNITPAVGQLAEHDIVLSIYRHVPQYASLVGGAPLTGTAIPALIRGIEGASRASKTGSVLLIDWRKNLDTPAWQPHYLVFADHLRRYARSVDILALEDLATGALSIPADALAYRFFVVDEIETSDQAEMVQTFLERAHRANAIVCGSFFEDALGKACLAYLSGTRSTYDSGPVRLPWTRILGDGKAEAPGGQMVDLPDWVESNQHDLVVKRSRGFAGREVVIGREVPEADWRAAISTAVACESDLFVVQRFVDRPREQVVVLDDGGASLSWMNVDYGVLICGGTLAGVTRHAREDSANIHGADFAPAVWAS